MSGIKLMLASPGPTGDPLSVIAAMQASKAWSWEFKYDGIRALVRVEDGQVKITNRRDVDITYRYPDVVAAMSGMRNVLLDGEIVSTDPQGRPDFSRIHRRDAQVTAVRARQLATLLPAQFVVFDILIRSGVDLRMLTYEHRREHLQDLTEELAAHGVTAPPVCDDGLTAWHVVQSMDLEGLVAKRKDSRYVGRRSGAWIKIKATRRVSALVSGYDQGNGDRAATFGALRLGLLDDQGKLVDVGSVGSGFSSADVLTVWERLEQGAHPIVVEVAYLEVAPSGTLRQPVFKGLRTDVDPANCTLAQLEGAERMK